MTDDGAPTLTGVNFAGSEKKESAAGLATASNPDQCDINAAPLCTVGW